MNFVSINTVTSTLCVTSAQTNLSKLYIVFQSLWLQYILWTNNKSCLLPSYSEVLKSLWWGEISCFGLNLHHHCPASTDPFHTVMAWLKIAERAKARSDLITMCKRSFFRLSQTAQLWPFWNWSTFLKSIKPAFSPCCSSKSLQKSSPLLITSWSVGVERMKSVCC